MTGFYPGRMRAPTWRAVHSKTNSSAAMSASSDRKRIRRWSARNRSSRGAWVNDKLKQGTIRVPEIHADSSTAATVTVHRTRFDGDTMLGEVLRQVLDAPGPYQTQITASRDHWWVSDQGADVETWAVDVQLLVSETEGDPTVGMVNHPRAEHVAIEVAIEGD
jgi:hypothetical protein